jgi:hypothetical protein
VSVWRQELGPYVRYAYQRLQYLHVVFLTLCASDGGLLDAMPSKGSRMFLIGSLGAYLQGVERMIPSYSTWNNTLDPSLTPFS